LAICAILGIIFVFLLLSDYNANWMHPEVTAFHIPYSLENGCVLSLKDLLKSFDSWEFDFQNSRPRFFSYFFQIINLKFRIWLFAFIPPHPSLSLTWIFTLLLSPFFLFRLVRNLSLNRVTAWIAVILYFLSPGFLSHLTLLFHPGKPLASFFTILCLYLSSEIWLGIKVARTFNKKGYALFALLLAIIFLAFITDEVSFFIFFAVPLLFPEIFTLPPDKIRISRYYRFTFIAFLLFLTFVVPWITRHLGFGDFNFWDYIKRGGTGERYYLWKNMDIANLFLNGHYLLSSHIVPFRKPDLGRFFKLDIYAYAAFIFYCSYAYRRLSPAAKDIFKRLGLTLLAFIFFHFLISSRHLKLTTDCYYYGAVFSILFAILLAILLTANTGALKIINGILLAVFLVIFASNFYAMNKRWISSHNIWYKHFFPEAARIMPEEKRLDRNMVLTAWQHRKDKTYLQGVQKQFPLRADWLFVELDYIK